MRTRPVTTAATSAMLALVVVSTTAASAGDEAGDAPVPAPTTEAPGTEEPAPSPTPSPEPTVLALHTQVPAFLQPGEKAELKVRVTASGPAARDGRLAITSKTALTIDPTCTKADDVCKLGSVEAAGVTIPVTVKLPAKSKADVVTLVIAASADDAPTVKDEIKLKVKTVATPKPPPKNDTGEDGDKDEDKGGGKDGDKDADKRSDNDSGQSGSGSGSGSTGTIDDDSSSPSTNTQSTTTLPMDDSPSPSTDTILPQVAPSPGPTSTVMPDTYLRSAHSEPSPMAIAGQTAWVTALFAAGVALMARARHMQRERSRVRRQRRRASGRTAQPFRSSATAPYATLAPPRHTADMGFASATTLASAMALSAGSDSAAAPVVAPFTRRQAFRTLITGRSQPRRATPAHAIRQETSTGRLRTISRGRSTRR